MVYDTELLDKFLEDAWDTSRAEGAPLLETIRTKEKAADALVTATGSLSSVSKNSANQSYATPHPENLTQLKIAKHWARLRRMARMAATALGAAIDGSEDSAIHDELSIRVGTPTTEAYSDISAARCYA